MNICTETNSHSLNIVEFGRVTVSRYTKMSATRVFMKHQVLPDVVDVTPAALAEVMICTECG